MEVKDAQTHFVVANTTNTRRAAFTVTGLRPGTGYIVSVHSFNPKGSSEEMVIHAFTARCGWNQNLYDLNRGINSNQFLLTGRGRAARS